MRIENQSNNYRKAVALIAINENVNSLNIEEITEYMSVFVISELFKVNTETIAEDILKIRSYIAKTKKIILK